MNGRKIILTCSKYKRYGIKSRKFVKNGCINLSNRWNNIFISKRNNFIPRSFIGGEDGVPGEIHRPAKIIIFCTEISQDMIVISFSMI
jgi:hypothetical protein